RNISRSAARRATVVCAKAGYSASRSFHQSASDPCGSISIRTTGPAPAYCAWTARCPDKVVLPDPPFCDANARTRTIFPSNSGFRDWIAMRATKIWLTHQPEQLCERGFSIFIANVELRLFLCIRATGGSHEHETAFFGS